MDLRRIVLAGIFGVVSACAAWAAVEYVDPTDGGAVKSCEAALWAGTTSWQNGKWYVAEGSARVPERIQVGGNVNLILKDGAVLSATNGIRVPKGASLTIWGQQGGSGRLEATGASSCAGIGGNKEESGGTVTINGGVVVAQGGQYGAGIGGGDTGNGGSVTVNGGEVEATGKEGSAGIGGGDYGNGGAFAITGGKVTATGSTRNWKESGQASPGIGAGRPKVDGSEPRKSGTVAIWGGEVIAKAGVPDTSREHPTPAQAIGVNVDDADYNEKDNADWLTLGEVAVVASADAAEPVAVADRGAACRGMTVWTRPCEHRFQGLTCAWCGGTAETGTAEDPYRIGDYAALVQFAGKVNGGQSDACGVLTADIVAEGADWVPIGADDDQIYCGTFDGAGHRISGLANAGSIKYAGLFGGVWGGGVVRNVRLEGVAFQGGLAGGVVGVIYGGTVSNCYVSGRVISGDDAGGIVGFNSNGLVVDCHNAGEVTGNVVGGVVGNQARGSAARVSNCHSTGAVSGERELGGVVGCLSYGTVANSYCLDSVGATAIGLNAGTVDGECKELTAAEYTNAASFQGWDFENVWWMGPEMPLLRVFGPLELTVESAYGTAVPSAGAHGYYRGEAVEARVEGSPVSLGEGRLATCTGWVLEGNGPGSGEGTEARFTLTNSAVLRWTWKTKSLEAQVTVGAGQWRVVSVPFQNAASEDGAYKFGDTQMASELPQGSTVLFWDEAGQEWRGGMKSARGWAWGQGSHLLGCGEAFSVRNGGGGEATLTVGGEIPAEGVRSRGYAGGGKWSGMAPMYPVPVKFGDTELANVLPGGSKVRFWDAGRQEWVEGTKTGKGWEGVASHVLGVGEGFFIQSGSAGTWEQAKPRELP